MNTSPCHKGCVDYAFNLNPVLSDDGELRIIGTCLHCGAERIMGIPARHVRRNNSKVRKVLHYISNIPWVMALILMVWLITVVYTFTKSLL